MMRVLVCLVLLTVGAAAASARDNGELYDFLGRWHNVAQGGDGVTRLEIRRAEEDRVRVAVWGSCGDEECSYGTATGRLFVSDRTNESDQSALLVKFARAQVSGDVLVRVGRSGNLITHALLSFKNRRGDVYRTDKFERDERYESRDDDEDDDNDRYSRDDHGDRYGRRY